MENKSTVWKKLLEDLEEIYMRAIEKGNYSAALKAKELIGKEMGFFENAKKIGKNLSLKDLDIKSLSEPDLQRLIKALEEAVGELECGQKK